MANISLPNPDIYLNHLPPAVANQFEVARNIHLAVLGAAIWDILVYIPEDAKILFGGFSIVNLYFIFSRVFSVTYALLIVIVKTHPSENYTGMQDTMGILCLLAMACTSFLFLRRLQAVYAESRVVQWIFCFLWFAITANSITVIFGIHAERIKGTGYCVVYEIKGYVAVNELLPAIFDTLVFFAIAYKLVSSRSAFDPNADWSTFITGKALPSPSRALLPGGQQYYFIVFGMTIISAVILYTPSVPVVYRPMFTLASSVSTASMACRVFRNLKARDHDHQSSTVIIGSGINFARDATSHRSTPPISRRTQNESYLPTNRPHGQDPSTTNPSHLQTVAA